jgi:hypothetical protein
MLFYFTDFVLTPENKVTFAIIFVIAILLMTAVNFCVLFLYQVKKVFTQLKIYIVKK